MDNILVEELKDIVGVGGMSLEEYKYICEVTTNKGDNPNILVFSMGRDSKIWNKINNDGVTIFLEDNIEWIDKVSTSDMEYYKITYDVPRIKWRDLTNSAKNDGDNTLLIKNLPTKVKDTKWDIILVDGPLGGYDGTLKGNGPGRAQSIFTAHYLSENNVDIFIHDCDREIENVCSDTLFKSVDLIKRIKTLKHYKISD